MLKKITSKITHPLGDKLKHFGVVSALLVQSATISYAQTALVPPNQKTTWKEPIFSNFTVNSSASGYQGPIALSHDTTKWLTSPQNIIDTDANNFASVRLVTYGSSNSSNRVAAEAALIVENNQTYAANSLIQFTA